MEPHTHQHKPHEPKQDHDEVAKKAYDPYLKEGRPQGRDVQNWLEAGTEIMKPHTIPKQSLQQRCGIWLDWQNIFLGTGLADRYHVAWALD